ncbi:hypothetical protein JHK87_055827 [Glycine soja]|nr:hypothetical protein JHK87_055827 [Glycine soja]
MKGDKVMNSTDAYQKELQKKELKRKERKKVKEVWIFKKDPNQLKKQIDNLEMMKRKFILGLMSLTCNVQRAIQIHDDLSPSAKGPAKLLTTCFDGIKDILNPMKNK